MLTIIANVLGALLQSQTGRFFLFGVVAGMVGFYSGFREGDKGRVRLQERVRIETELLISNELKKQREIVAKAEAEAKEEEKEDRQREILLAEAGARISELEAEAAKVSDKGKPCVVPREMVKAINKAGR